MSLPAGSPDSAAVAEAATALHAVYVHIPFCRRICPYCDFAVTSDTSLADRYVDAVCAEIDRAERFDRPPAAVAVGGGTPTSLPSRDLARILGALRDRFGWEKGCEVSIEANPEDIEPAVLDGLAEAGVDRISLGVQSFDDAVLDDLGRVHDAVQARDAVTAARHAFRSVNIDLIFGSPAETDESWAASVATALDLGVDHVSTYALTVERGTPLSRAIAAGAPAPDPDVQADRWAAAADALAAEGLVRYETSNHARAGHPVVYNLITWGQGEYEAFGNGAHRHRVGTRSWNVRRVGRYVERIEAGIEATSGSEPIEGWAAEVERVMLGLRRAAGVSAGQAGACLIESERGKALLDAGVVALQGDRLVMTRPMLTDEVARTLLALEPYDC